MSRKEKLCRKCVCYDTETVNILEHDPCKSIPEVKKREYGYCDHFCDVLPNDYAMQNFMAKNCPFYDNNEED